MSNRAPLPQYARRNQPPISRSTPRPARASSPDIRDTPDLQSACTALPISAPSFSDFRAACYPSHQRLVPQPTAVVYFRRMAPKKTTLKEIGEMLAHVVKHMATKDDIARLDAKIDSVESNLAGKINRLDTKLTKFEEHEIDKRKQLEVRVTAIEKHLGLDKKIAA
jgi:hypothetical protein